MTSGTGLLVVWTDVTSESEAEFNEWYDKEHVPQLLTIPGILTGRRYQAVEGKPKYIAIYEMADEKVWESPAFREVREKPTDWSKKMIPQSAIPNAGFSDRSFRMATAQPKRPSSR